MCDNVFSGGDKVTKVNVHEAKTHLSKLLEKAMNGEEVVIAKAGKPRVRPENGRIGKKIPAPVWCRLRP